MNINRQSRILNNIKIAAPCSASWDDMVGDDKVRDCSQCNLSVYDLSKMSRKEAGDLIVEREGKLCVRLYRRADGTVITDNCPIGLRKIRDSFKNLARIAAAILTIVFSFPRAQAENENSEKAKGALMGDIQIVDSKKANKTNKKAEKPIPTTSKPVTIPGRVSTPPVSKDNK